MLLQSPIILDLFILSVSPFNGSYSVTLPSSIDLANEGSFQISLTENNLLENQTLNIDIDDTFILHDSHGKPDIYGYVENNEIVFTNTDEDTKIVNYEIENSSAGQWSGSLNIAISLNQENSSNYTMMSGTSINNIIKNLSFDTITFSHDDITGDYLYDISQDQDESVLLYLNNSNLIITNKANAPIKANTDMSNLFRNLSSVTAINNLNYVDMSACTNMSKMFQNCYGLSNIDVTSFDTANVTNMSYLFDNAYNLETIGDISDWDVSNVTTFQNLFYDCKMIHDYGNLGKWNVSNKCTNLSKMFATMSFTTGVADSSRFPAELDLRGWDVSNVTNMSYMFKDCFALENLNITGWNTSKVTNTEHMFEMIDGTIVSQLTNIYGLDSIDVSSLSTMRYMFKNCSYFNCDFSHWQPSALRKMDQAFYYCRNLDLSSLENWNQYFTGTVTYANAFGNNAGADSHTSPPSWAN